MNASKRTVHRKFSQKGLLREWYLQLTAPERRALLNEVGITGSYIMQIYGGHSAAGIAVAESIESASDGVIKVRYLRPDLFAL